MAQDIPPSPDKGSQPPKAEAGGLVKFWQELRRRKVVRVAITYMAVAWLLMQFAALVFPQVGLPDWAPVFVTWILIIGFPIAVIIAWAFELTPEGIKTTKTAQTTRATTEEQASHSRKRNWVAYAMGAVIPTLIFGTLALFFFIRSDTSADAIDSSIAVLPLDNLSPDPENGFFADGVHEDILTNLSRIQDLLVIGRTSTLQYRATTKTLRQIGSELGVRYLVEGSVRRAMQEVVVTVQLIDSQTGGHIWAENYKRNLDDPFAIQAEVALDIAEKLQAVLSPAEKALIERRPTNSPEAYDLFVKSRQVDGLEEIELMEKVVELDPKFAEAWALLARERLSYWELHKGRDDPQLLASAHIALEKAKQFGPDLPYIPWVQSYFALREDEDYEASIDLLLKALSIDPKFLPALRALAGRYRQIYRLAEAERYAEMALRLDPLNNSTNVILSTIYRFRSKWDECRSLIELNLARDPESKNWRLRLATLDYQLNGDITDYIEAVETIPDLMQENELKAWKALLTRDLETASNHLDRIYLRSSSIAENRLRLFRGGYGLWMRPLNMLSALVAFELGQIEKQKVEAEKARKYLEGIVEVDPIADPNFWSNLMVSYALEGNKAKMEYAMAKSHEQLISSSRWQFSHFHQHEKYYETYVAIAYIVIGETEKAIEELETASQMESFIYFKEELKLWFIFDRLRDHPRFDSLLKD